MNWAAETHVIGGIRWENEGALGGAWQTIS
jgi:hypothetical protein